MKRKVHEIVINEHRLYQWGQNKGGGRRKPKQRKVTTPDRLINRHYLYIRN